MGRTLAGPLSSSAWLQWLPVAAGLLSAYVPVFYALAGTLWQSDDHAHGPVILAVVVWLLWRKREVLRKRIGGGAPGAGLALLALGLVAYMVGRAYSITILEVGSLIPVLAGITVAMRGWSPFRELAFPILFVAFMVPLPGMLVDALTGPLKQRVSEIAEWLLYLSGYPVARSGVTLNVGQYQLLVADACSGLNSMFSLSALGLLYLYLVRHERWLHNGLILASILPIAFAANIVRVLTLVLVTYHFGDAAGQGFLHGSAGLLLVVIALAIILFLDGALTSLFAPRKAA
jgi:exosortase B